MTMKNVDLLIKVPKKWEMYTPQGNQVLEKKAKTLVKNIQKVKNTTQDYIDYLVAFDKFFKSYEKSSYENKTCEGSRDKEVRIMVLSFAKNVAKLISVSEESIESLWNQRHKYKKKSLNSETVKNNTIIGF